MADLVMKRNGAARLSGVLLLAVCAAGCGGGQADLERYVPSEPVARRALEAALAAWKTGEPVGSLRLADPPLNLAVDHANWQPGQCLLDYQIVGEVASEGPRSFVVRLFLDAPREELEVRYFVSGIDPLSVMRQEAFDVVTHWEMKMPDDQAESKQP
ncbi:MAG TPA: hypothetical protein VND64_25955 [Pirellulales bacterium]|nr:hypothetical protein [Pirellulales bacterium]